MTDELFNHNNYCSIIELCTVIGIAWGDKVKGQCERNTKQNKKNIEEWKSRKLKIENNGSLIGYRRLWRDMVVVKKR